MRYRIALALLGAIAWPTAAAELGGCADVHGAYSGSQAPAFELAGPRIETLGPVLLAGLEEPISGETADMQIDMLWTRFEQRNQWIVSAASDARTGVCFNGGAQQSFDYFAGQVLSGPADRLPDGFSTMALAANRYAVFTLTGQASDLGRAQSMVYLERLPAAGLTGADAPNLVVFPPGFSPAKRGATIELWVPIAP